MSQEQQNKHQELDENEELTTDEATENQNQKNKVLKEPSIQEQLEEEKNKYVRLYAEFDNFKKRSLKEREEQRFLANQSLMETLLPVLDDFERAIKELKKEEEENMLKGIELIQQKLVESLEKKGLKKLEVENGNEFDAELHEAVTQVDSPSEEMKGKIIDIIETGYQLGERVIRYPKVVVGK
ncbi:HSP-70 cofactor [Candidatus Ornithobacterium hominis]|uniref:Protein GrpE n=1 Tax=Candidatus Ornithobacterium hominis TaxID=2497989 RepID=A0A383U0A5_9FLAO|nr:nucleotide exchange factor GrpE [Candidatus Ornithobacterium hominis]MCT7904267.1 nucleotide exchange factor GrpE [Candidatus Ornithobacterium hominis]SZD72930.1 HSP-70 cofactor [Candidatus Ornithobacterium hominis]SZD73130.1 HSP-70 cofactor [Candidatus Ornithobacterium hominis]